MTLCVMKPRSGGTHTRPLTRVEAGRPDGASAERAPRESPALGRFPCVFTFAPSVSVSGSKGPLSTRTSACRAAPTRGPHFGCVTCADALSDTATL